ncbi:MAG: DUF3581 family protein [Pseudomonadota bacterium]
MLIDQYCHQNNDKVWFTREQGSNFAKRLADDFNPLHDANGKRFCVPGDLLFAVILARYGINERMKFEFTNMVPDSVQLLLPSPSDHLSIEDETGRQYLQVTRSGVNSCDESLISGLTRSYVEFSGHSFPHILVPLLAEQGVMINPRRPMVIYESMVIELGNPRAGQPVLQSSSNEFTLEGRRGSAQLSFDILDRGATVGRGQKRMVLGGLMEYDEDAMSEAVAEHSNRKRQFLDL